MEFKQLNHKMQKHFKNLVKDVDYLFETNINKDEVWEMYLDGYKPEDNKIFRERREMDCSCCRHFIKNMGNLIAIKDGVIHTMWGFNAGNEKFQNTLDKLDAHIKKTPIASVWINKENKIGVEENYERLEDGTMLTWNHFMLDIPSKFNYSSRRESEAEIRGELGTTRNVFKRSLEELTVDSIETVLELIGQRSLSKGEEWKGVLELFLKLKKEYESIPTEVEKRIYTWDTSTKVGGSVARIRNTSMGTLLLDLSNNVELNEAVQAYEKIVDPSNYKRVKTVYTQKMLDDAAKTVREEGYEESLGRRHAQLEDITVNDVLFSNKDSAKQMIGGMDVFAQMSSEVKSNPKKFDRVEEIGIDDFLKNVLPAAQEVEVYFENKHSKNMASLIAPINKDSKTMFKWNNNFSHAYTGNMAGSSMRENVKSAGGSVDGVLRFSIQWNDGDTHDQNDLDLHAVEPGGNRIFFGSSSSYGTGGRLDVDIQHPHSGKPAVENITWLRKDKMRKGVYQMIVNNYMNRGGREGFKAEIEADGEILSFEYNRELRTNEDVHVANATLGADGKFTINPLLPSTTSSKEVWGLNTNQFIPVSVVTHSPNHWEESTRTGAKHLFFFLKGAKNPEKPNGWYGEFLKEELLKHKRVFEALSGKMAVQEVSEQLSGLGFTYDKREELIVKVKSNVERVVKVKF